MDLRQLRQFVAVAEECSFRRAAQRLHVSQPPLSVAVQKLEADVGVTLLDRTRHHVRLRLSICPAFSSKDSPPPPWGRT